MKKILITAVALLCCTSYAHAADLSDAAEEARAKQEATAVETATQVETQSQTVHANADPNSVRATFVSPFRYNSVDAMLLKRNWQDINRSYAVEDDFALFDASYARLMQKTGLCASAAGSTTATKLQDCANKYPDEFAAIALQMPSYQRWKTEELRQFTTLYANKWHSPLFRDRIQARLMDHCLHNALNANTDASDAVAKCRQSSNWDMSDLFAGLNPSVCTADPTTGTTGPSTTTTFSLGKFISNCVASPKLTTGSAGVKMAADLLPSIEITITATNGGGSVTQKLIPAKISPAQVYAVVFTRLTGGNVDAGTHTKAGLLFSNSFLRGFTSGRIPSAFAPDTESIAALAPYTSITIPPALLKEVRSLPKADRLDLLNRLAAKIAHIQTLEILRGAEILAAEAERALSATDKELGPMAGASREIAKISADAYEEAQKQTSTYTVADVLETINSLKQAYAEEEQRQAAADRQLEKEYGKTAVLWRRQTLNLGKKVKNTIDDLTDL